MVEVSSEASIKTRVARAREARACGGADTTHAAGNLSQHRGRVFAASARPTRRKRTTRKYGSRAIASITPSKRGGARARRLLSGWGDIGRLPEVRRAGSLDVRVRAAVRVSVSAGGGDAGEGAARTSGARSCGGAGSRSGRSRRVHDGGERAVRVLAIYFCSLKTSSRGGRIACHVGLRRAHRPTHREEL